MNQSGQLENIFAHLNDPKVMAEVNERFQALSAKYPATEIDRAIDRAKQAQWWHDNKDLRITI